MADDLIRCSIYDIIPPEVVQYTIGYMDIPTQLTMVRTSHGADRLIPKVHLDQIPLRLAIYSGVIYGENHPFMPGAHAVLYVGWFPNDVPVHQKLSLPSTDSTHGLPMEVAVFSIPHNTVLPGEKSPCLIEALDLRTLYSTDPIIRMVTHNGWTTETVETRSAPIVVRRKDAYSADITMKYWRYNIEVTYAQLMPTAITVINPGGTMEYIIDPVCRTYEPQHTLFMDVKLGSLVSTTKDNLFVHLSNHITPTHIMSEIAHYTLPAQHFRLFDAPCVKEWELGL